MHTPRRRVLGTAHYAALQLNVVKSIVRFLAYRTR
uniref:Uncharacterized protein n=1 Tax=Anguilla anguilla TaxID=7936 RepID=A0A0E9TY11_ANGAN